MANECLFLFSAFSSAVLTLDTRLFSGYVCLNAHTQALLHTLAVSDPQVTLKWLCALFVTGPLWKWASHSCSLGRGMSCLLPASRKFLPLGIMCRFLAQNLSACPLPLLKKQASPQTRKRCELNTCLSDRQPFSPAHLRLCDCWEEASAFRPLLCGCTELLRLGGGGGGGGEQLLPTQKPVS